MRRGAAGGWTLALLWAAAVLGLAGSLWINGAQSAAARDVNALIERAEEAVMAGDWPRAHEAAGAAQQAWERTRKVWSLHTEHQELDAISDLLVEAAARVAVADSRAAVALRRARHRIDALPRRDALTVENVF